MAKYYGSNNIAGTQQVMTTTFKTLITLTSPVTVKRAKIFEIKCGQNGTPAGTDTSIEFDVSAVTAVGTGTGVTATKFDAGDGATTMLVTANHTAEPTVTAASSVWGVSGNQRAPFGWVALTDSAMLVGPATSANGFALRCKSPGYTGTAFGAISFDD